MRSGGGGAQRVFVNDNPCVWEDGRDTTEYTATTP